jgi:ribosomal protein S18 acetylase RimI-like enzyme
VVNATDEKSLRARAKDGSVARMGSSVRAARLEDAASIARVHVDTWREAYRGVVSDEALAAIDVDARVRMWRDLLGAGRARVLVACDDAGGIFGFASCGASRDPDMAGGGELYTLYVSSSHRHAGAGRALLAGAVDALAALGCHDAGLWVLVDNPRARRFYEAHGWTADPDGARLPSPGRRVVTTGTAAGLVEMRYRRVLGSGSSTT